MSRLGYTYEKPAGVAIVTGKAVDNKNKENIPNLNLMSLQSICELRNESLRGLCRQKNY